VIGRLRFVCELANWQWKGVAAAYEKGVEKVESRGKLAMVTEYFVYCIVVLPVWQ
jgi:hypothetical protein